MSVCGAKRTCRLRSAILAYLGKPISAEAVAGLYWMYALTGDARHLDRLEATIAFIEISQRDNANPGTEWFWGITPDGGIGARGDHKGEEWKDSYHGSRALSFTEAWIEAAQR